MTWNTVEIGPRFDGSDAMGPKSPQWRCEADGRICTVRRRKLMMIWSSFGKDGYSWRGGFQRLAAALHGNND
jgi:hypothetical protein